MESAVFCIWGAMMGAGFASGREITQFFTQWGAYSWPLIALSSIAMYGMTAYFLRENSVKLLLPRGKGRVFGRALLFLLYALVSGAMAAAAGELAALTVPLPYARTGGSLLTVLLCAALNVGSLSAGAGMGRLLIPLYLLALYCCGRLPPEGGPGPARITLLAGTLAALRAVGYAGLNVMLSSGVICQAGQNRSEQEKRQIALLTGGGIALLLCLGNRALLPHRQAVSQAVLPVVALLRSYGKDGFYLSALVLYLAVASTLWALLRGMQDILSERMGEGEARAFSVLCTLGASLLSMEGIVSHAYPVLGWAGLFLITFSGLQKYLKEKELAIRPFGPKR